MPLPDRNLPFREWYDLLAKPSWTPEVATIGLVWSVLYPILAVVSGVVLYQSLRGAWPRNLFVPLGLNLTVNLLFTPVQFGLRNFVLASIVVSLVFLTALWLCIALWPHSKLVSGLLMPYVLWTAIATVLQISLTWLNR